MTKTAFSVICALCLAFAPARTSIADAPSVSNSIPVDGTSADMVSLSVWNDPGFQKRFAESYLAETEIEPRVTTSERGQMQKVLEQLAADDMEGASEALRRGMTDASSAVFDFTLANIYFQQEQLDEAAEAYSVAVEKYPKFRRAWRNLGLIYVRQGKPVLAIEALTRVIELGGNDALAYGLLGFSYASAERYVPSESAYRMAVLLDADTMDWQMGLARSLFRQERYVDAAALCGGLLQDNPNRVDLWLLQANAYIGQGDYGRAAENYELVDQLGGSTAESLHTLGDIYINEGLSAMAVDAYSRAMDFDASKGPARPTRAAGALASKGDLAESIRLVDQIERVFGGRLSPEDRKGLLKLRSRFAVASGAGEEEARVLEEIVSIDPLDGEALILLGQYYRRSGDTEKAVFYYERAASIEKHEADAKVRHAQLLVSQGKYTAALPLLRSAQRVEPRENVQAYLEQIERVAK